MEGNQSLFSRIEHYQRFLFVAGARLGQVNLGVRFGKQLLEGSVPLIQGLQVVDEKDTNYNDERLRS